MQKILLTISLMLGGLIAYVDTRPTWDDTGITVFAVLICSAVLGFLGPHRPWLWALAIGIWIPLFEVLPSMNLGPLMALVVAFLGAYLGMVVRRGFAALA